MSNSRSDRIETIKNILISRQIGSQEELIKALEAKGLACTQATLSRDLKELKVVKVPLADGYRYTLPQAAPVHIVPHKGGADGIRKMEVSGQLGVIKTQPGYANLLASIIDNQITDNDIMGTIAGDDTILVIFRSADCVPSALATLSSVIPGIGRKIVLI